MYVGLLVSFLSVFGVQAMGCLLFKLCFFQDAFEATKLSVLSGRYRVPAKHSFSPEILQLISMPRTSSILTPQCLTQLTIHRGTA